MSSELDSWSEASGEPGDPSAMSRQHLRRAIKHILKSYEFSDFGSGRGEPERTIGRIWDKSQENPGAVAEAFGSAILEGKLSIGYVMTRLNGGRHQPAARSSGTPTPSHDREEGSDPTRAEEPKTAPLPVEEEFYLDGLTELFRKSMIRDPDANPQCDACGGSGYEVDWYPSGPGTQGDVPIGKYGHCRICLNGKSEPKGLGLWLPPGTDPKVREYLSGASGKGYKTEYSTKDESASGHIYFIQAGGPTGPIKIGWAIDPEERLKQLQSGNDRVLEIIGTIPGTVRDEKALHAKFSSDRIKGEWFRCTSDVVSLMGFESPRSEDPKTKPEYDFFLTNRSVFDHWTFTEAPDWVFKLWVYLTGHASHTDKDDLTLGFKVLVLRGQLVTTIRNISYDIGRSVSSVHHWLCRFYDDGMILCESGEETPDDTTERCSERCRRKTRTLSGTLKSTKYTRITILNYNKFQGGRQGNHLATRTLMRTLKTKKTNADANAAADIKGRKNIKEGKEEIPPTPSLTATDFLNAYEQNHGTLQGYGGFLVTDANLGHALTIMKGLTSVCQTPEAALEKWVEVIKYAAANVDESNRWFIDMKWFAKDIDNCRKVLEGKFNHPFGKGEDHGARKRSGQGNFEGFAGKGKGKTEQVRKVIEGSVRGRTSGLPGVPGHTLGSDRGQGGHETDDQVQVLGPEGGKRENKPMDPGKV